MNEIDQATMQKKIENLMNASELRFRIENAGTAPHFFDRKTMRFFGDTMRNFGVCRASVRTSYNAKGEYDPENGVIVECWELYRRRPVKHGLQTSHYFSVDGYKPVSPAR